MILYTTTNDDNHNKLRIINSFMRTIRGNMNDVGENDILNLVDSYNDIPHK